MVFLKQSEISVEYNVNGTYFSNCNLSSLPMETNGNRFASMSFPNNIATLFYHTEKSDTYKMKKICCLFCHSKMVARYTLGIYARVNGNVINIEKSSNVGINFQTVKAVTENNRLLFL